MTEEQHKSSKHKHCQKCEQIQDTTVTWQLYDVKTQQQLQQKDIPGRLLYGEYYKRSHCNAYCIYTFSDLRIGRLRSNQISNRIGCY